MRITDCGRKLLKDDRGSVIIETSLAIVIIMAVFLSGIYFLTAYRTKIIMEMAVKEGARQYQVSHDTSNTTKELALGNISGVHVSISGNSILATKKLNITMPIIGDYLFNLKASADFRKENAINFYR